MADLSCIPLLDSGYYFKIEDQRTILTKNQVKTTKIYLPGGILASEVGSGKTISVIGLISINDLSQDKTLVIVTKNILYQWNDEFKKFCPKMRIYLLDDENNFILEDFKIYDPHVILTYREIIEEAKFPDFLQQMEKKPNSVQKSKKNSNKNDLLLKNEILFQKHKFLKELAQIPRKFTWGITGTPNDLEFYNNISEFQEL